MFGWEVLLVAFYNILHADSLTASDLEKSQKSAMLDLQNFNFLVVWLENHPGPINSCPLNKWLSVIAKDLKIL